MSRSDDRPNLNPSDRSARSGRSTSDLIAARMRAEEDHRPKQSLRSVESVDRSRQAREDRRAEPRADQEVELRDSKGVIRHEVSAAEAAHYDRLGLHPREVAEREALVRSDISWDQRDAYGQTNADRAARGLAPLDQEGDPYELHHIRQKDDGMLAELRGPEHTGKNVWETLHDPSKASEIDRPAFARHRAAHWKQRAAEQE